VSLNLKNEKTTQLIHELSRLTGESMTTAVTEAVQERIDRIRQEGKGDLAARLLRISKICAPRFKEQFRTVEHGDLLYDEKGLPR
jgi:antitoxin VapB